LEQITQRKAAASVPLSVLVYYFVKRLTDIVGAGLLLVILSPVMLSVALAIWLDSGLPIVYRCQRLGRYGRPITVLKFRTMRDGSHHHLEEVLSVDEERRLQFGLNRKLREDPRRTRVGGFLRRSSLDELPQLVNVLAGEMSLVGPRPYFPDELRGRREAVELLSVRPGITGLWQVNGRSERSFEERIELELSYVRRRGMALDVGILLRTVGAVVTGRGAY
jgi:lipopolysaccharide/colanic/teichoic acid biosynthesis glycosyltransferase